MQGTHGWRYQDHRAFEEFADHLVVFDHAVGIEAGAGDAVGFLVVVRPDAHAGGVEPDEEGFFVGDGLVHEFHGGVVENAR
jgi:hypothetical protein